MNTKPIGDNFILPGSYTLEQLKNIVKLAESAEEKFMNKRHKHYETIIAWAEGKEIQHIWNGRWHDWDTDDTPGFYEEQEYRIKPPPKPDVVKNVYLGNNYLVWDVTENPNLRLTFDGETGKLKQAEVIDGSA